ncbi:unnamed protein product [Arabidopsis thaliana]|uniref:Uncharacterized protein n=1 Tax=Arabidopsis thaliana TaxID=3702 RepID=A0A654EC41_ARATH|nr:unnamed protein product [Arabidopsis thaliana]
MFLGEGSYSRTVSSRYPDDNFVTPEEEYEPSLPSSESPTDSCHADHESPDSPKYQQPAPGERPECEIYKDLCSDPQTVDWAAPPLKIRDGRHQELFLLYAEITLFSHWASIKLVEWAKPLELIYVIVQTWEPKLTMKAKAANANFYVTFSNRHGFPYHAVIRRTTTRIPNQMSLEFKMLMRSK